MIQKALRHAAPPLAVLALACAALAGPVTPEEAARQNSVINALTGSLASAKDDGPKLAALEAAVRDPSVEVRRRVLELAGTALSREHDKFFKTVLEKDADAGIRGQAAAALGKLGSADSIPALANAAKADPIAKSAASSAAAPPAAMRSSPWPTWRSASPSRPPTSSPSCGSSPRPRRKTATPSRRRCSA